MERERMSEILTRLLALPHRVIDEADVVERRRFARAVADAVLYVERLIEIRERLLLVARVEGFERGVRERRGEFVAVAKLPEERHRAVVILVRLRARALM